MTKNDILLVGGGGHCKSVIDVIQSEGKYNIVGIIDKKEKLGEEISGHKIIGTDDDLELLAQQFKHFVITIGFIKNSEPRIRLFERLKCLGAIFPVIVSPKGYISSNSKIGEGTVVMHNTVVNSGSVIGQNCIINTGAIIEHDATIGNHCHISTSSIINGDCAISDSCFIGSGSVIIHGVSIASNTILGAGAVITKSIQFSNQTFVGNPARLIKGINDVK